VPQTNGEVKPLPQFEHELRPASITNLHDLQ
jgi:hypothetical protein